MSEIEATISRINSYPGVDRILIIKSSDTEDAQNVLIRSLSPGQEKDETDQAKKFAQMIPQIGKEARSLIRQLEPKNDLTFLRIRTTNNEVLIAPDKDFYLCVLQKLTKK